MNKMRYLDLYTVPTLKQKLYLGIDAWKKFNLFVIMINEIYNERAAKESIDPYEEKLIIVQHF